MGITSVSDSLKKSESCISLFWYINPWSEVIKIFTELETPIFFTNLINSSIESSTASKTLPSVFFESPVASILSWY